MQALTQYFCQTTVIVIVFFYNQEEYHQYFLSHAGITI